MWRAPRYFPRSAVQVGRTERVGQQLGEPPRAGRMGDEQIRTPVLEQHLPAPSAGHQNLAVRAHADEREKPATPARM